MGYTYLVQILPVLVVSPLYFAGTVELGVITQSTGAFNHVLNDLSIIVNQFESLSSFSAGLGRLSTFVERMESYQADPTNATFQLSPDHLERLVAAGAPAPPPPRSLWDWVRYGREGNPAAAQPPATEEDELNTNPSPTPTPAPAPNPDPDPIPNPHANPSPNSQDWRPLLFVAPESSIDYVVAQVSLNPNPHPHPYPNPPLP